MFASLRRSWTGLPLAARFAVVVWTALLVGVTCRVTFAKPTSQSVMPIYLAAGERWIAGSDLYVIVPGQDLYRNPPGVAAGFAAMTPLPEKLAGVLWRLFGAGVFLLGLARLRRDLASDLTATQAGVLYLLSAGLVLQAFNNGQINLLLAAGILHGTSATLRGRYWEAAFWFGLGGWFKVYPLAAGLLVALVHPWRFGPKLLAVTLAGAVLPLVFQDPAYVWEQYRSYFDGFGADDRTYAAFYRAPRDWTTIPRAWAGWIVPPMLTKVVSLTAAGLAAGGVGWNALQGMGRRIVLGRALVLGSVWMTAFGPATEANTYAILAGPAAWVAVAATGRARWVAWTGMTLLLLTIARGLFPQDWQFQILGPQAVGAVLVGIAGMTIRASVPAAPFFISKRWQSRVRLWRNTTPGVVSQDAQAGVGG